MSVWDDMAHDAGYRGDEARQVAAMVEQQEREKAEEYDDEWACTHCNGEGFCWDGADPLGDCPDEIHACHACHGSGKRKDQTVF